MFAASVAGAPRLLQAGARLARCGEHITPLPGSLSSFEHWRTAIARPIAAGEKHGTVLMARIAVVQALQAGKPRPAPEPRKRHAKEYRIVS
jgi:hypothetical protein